MKVPHAIHEGIVNPDVVAATHPCPRSLGNLAPGLYRPTGWAHACCAPHRRSSTLGEACLPALLLRDFGQGISQITGAPFCEVRTCKGKQVESNTVFWYLAYSGCCYWSHAREQGQEEPRVQLCVVGSEETSS